MPGKPDDIPQDVWDRAEDRLRGFSHIHSSTEIVARVILAERDRIVALIPQFVDQITAEDIAAAIRSGGA